MGKYIRHLVRIHVCTVLHNLPLLQHPFSWNKVRHVRKRVLRWASSKAGLNLRDNSYLDSPETPCHVVSLELPINFNYLSLLIIDAWTCISAVEQIFFWFAWNLCLKKQYGVHNVAEDWCNELRLRACSDLHWPERVPLLCSLHDGAYRLVIQGSSPISSWHLASSCSTNLHLITPDTDEKHIESTQRHMLTRNSLETPPRVSRPPT